MGKLCDLGQWKSTTLVDLVEDADNRPGPKMDSVVLGMESGKTVAIIVITTDRDIDVEIAILRDQIEADVVGEAA